MKTAPPASCLYLDSLLVGHDMRIGDDKSILRHDEAGATGDGNLTFWEDHPEQRDRERQRIWRQA